MKNPTRPTIHRRRLLQQGAAAGLLAPLLGALPARAQDAPRRFAPQRADWRSFEVSTTVTVADPQGTSRVWIPAPSVETDYQRSVDSSWSGNATQAAMVSDPARGVRMLYAEFAPSVSAPTITLVSQVRTRNRAVDWSRSEPVQEDPATLRAALAPAELIPLDGIVRKTATEATRGAHTDLEKVQALYRWVVANAHREPKVRGCGTGDIKAMLETGDLSGKCADLNALFVGLCRAVGVPANIQKTGKISP